MTDASGRLPHRVCTPLLTFYRGGGRGLQMHQTEAEAS